MDRNDLQGSLLSKRDVARHEVMITSKERLFLRKRLYRDEPRIGNRKFAKDRIAKPVRTKRWKRSIEIILCKDLVQPRFFRDELRLVDPV